MGVSTGQEQEQGVGKDPKGRGGLTLAAAASRVSGSGMGPSIAQRLSSYLLLMKLSILLPGGVGYMVSAWGQGDYNKGGGYGLVWGHVARFEVSFPVEVCPPVAPSLHVLDLFGGPGVEVDGADPRDVYAHSAVVARAAYAQPAPQVGRGPPGVVALAVCAEFVVGLLEEVLEEGEVPLRRRAVLRVPLTHRCTVLWLTGGSLGERVSGESSEYRRLGVSLCSARLDSLSLCSHTHSG